MLPCWATELTDGSLLLAWRRPWWRWDAEAVRGTLWQGQVNLVLMTIIV
ncbi:hypothetical protein MML61_27430 (plasmid) [Mycobacterium marinum]|nr:hypothetical protein [Mycobacterium marinum]WCS21237.1 hypothetical protein MML61_27430 [Mycobacterium marinum]